MKWITRERPKIDRLACPWLIRRFIDPEAEFLFAPESEVLLMASTVGAIAFDVPGAEYTHYERFCTFDYILKKHQLTDPALSRMAPIIRGADTDDHSLASQSPGLWAISAGLAFNIQDDQALLTQGFILYDALYTWASQLYQQKHIQTPAEKLLLNIYHTYLDHQKKTKVPDWVHELRQLIDTNLDSTLTLQELAENVNVNPSYLSREFSRYFENASFTEYLQQQRIDKALTLLRSSAYSLSEIAYLTGFSDQSHFTRVFKKYMDLTPNQFRKKQAKK